jgi:hypothetical protein
MAKTTLVIGWALATALWILAMTRWRQRTLERLPAGSSAWLWLRVFGVPETEVNRGKFIVYASVAGIAMTTVGVVIILVLGVA